jgi:hypothetical protein
MAPGVCETDVESAALTWLSELGWQVKHGPDIAPEGLFAERQDYGQVVLEQRLRDALARLNPDLPPEALQDAFRKLLNPPGATLEQRNRAFHRMLVDGVAVEYRRPDGAIAGAQVRILDFDDPDNNDWLAVSQFTVVENRHTRRPDVVLFVNGLPLAVIELKNPADEQANIWTAYWQLQTYKKEIPSLFTYNEVLVISDGLEARIGTLTADRDRFMPWRTITGETLAPPEMPQLEVLIRGVFDPGRFLQLLRDFIVFEDEGGGKLAKKMAGYHQFHAVNVAVEETLRAGALRASVVAEARGRYEAGRKPGGAPGDRRIGGDLAHARCRKEPDHGVLRRPDHPSPGDGEPDHCGPYRPQRPGRPALRRLLPLPRAPGTGAHPGGEPRPLAGAAAEPPGRWDHLHHNPEVLARGEGRPLPAALRPTQHRGHCRRGAPQPVRLHRRFRPATCGMPCPMRAS